MSLGEIAAVAFVSKSQGWVGCQVVYGAGQADKAIVETTDGGVTWRLRALTAFGKPPVGSIFGSDYLTDLSMRPNASGLAWEGRGGTLRTTDGGETWSMTPPGSFDTVLPYGGSAATDQDWYFVMWDGNLQTTALWASRDAGLHWHSVGPVPPVPST
jgi:photosystem II stability/assembly factor-like uncharacterized protein